MSLEEDITRLQEQERSLRFKSFNEADAWALGNQMRNAAAKAKLPIVIDIRVGQRQLFFAALPGTSSDNSEWVRRKVNAVLRFHKSTYHLGRLLEKSGSEFGPRRGIDIMDYAPDGGGFPIHIEGSGIIGVITVSGIPQRSDHGFVVEQLCKYLKKPHGKLALPAEDQ